MSFAKHSLVGRLVLSFLLPSLFILLLIAAIGYGQAEATLRESFFERLDGIARVKQAALETWVDLLYEQVLLLSELPDLGQRAAELGASADARFPEQAATSAQAEARRQILDLFELAAERWPSLDEVFLLSSAGGQVLVSTEPQNVGEFRIYDRYYVEGKLAPFVQNVYPSPVTLQPTMTISAPIRDSSGALIAVLAAHLSLDYLDASVLQSTGLGESGVVTLVDRHQVLVSGQLYGELKSAPAVTEAIEAVVAGNDGSGIYANLEGTQVLGVYRWLGQREIGLIVEMEQREALAPARRLAVSTFTAGSVLVAVLVFGIYWMAVRAARPILELTEAAERVTQGDLKTRAPIRTDDEIGALAGAFNSMVGQLASHYGEMTDKIQQLEQAEKALRLSLEELSIKNDELAAFNYTASHDLKSPLVTIKGFLGFVQEALEAGKIDRALGDIRRISDAADRMYELLNALLTLSQVGRDENPLEECSFEDLVRQAIDSVAGSKQRDHAEIVIVSSLPRVYVQRIRVVQVLENLIANALKHMRSQASPRIEIGVREDDGEAVFFVRDNGIGIDPSYHDLIFRLFERLDYEIEGTGVGLAIVRRVIEKHGGRIWVESEGVDHGSTFCFTLGDKASGPQRQRLPASD